MGAEILGRGPFRHFWLWTPEKTVRALAPTTLVQPVRLYYSIPNKPVIAHTLVALRCIAQDPGGRVWQWLYQHEAAAITFGPAR